jgi:hypothetical protein
MIVTVITAVVFPFVTGFAITFGIGRWRARRMVELARRVRALESAQIEVRVLGWPSLAISVLDLEHHGRVLHSGETFDVELTLRKYLAG